MKKIKLKNLFILTALFIGALNSFSQTSIDIVRASNYYSKASGYYRSSNYSSSLSSLKEAEANLKGKTNRDLEYLKIMTNYKLKHFAESYKLLQEYFEIGYKDRTAYFKNVETYDELTGINYEESLTSIFVELEDKYSVVSNTSSTDIISSIVARIKENKIPLKKFIETTTDTYESVYVFKYRTKKFRQGYGGYEYGNWQSLNISLEGEVSKDRIRYEGGYRVFVTVKFVETGKTITTSSYRYTHKYSNTKISGTASIKGSGYQISTSYGIKDTSFENGFNDYAIRALRNYDYCSEKSEEYSIYFTETEQLILEQEGNLEKLRKALGEANLL